MSKTVYRGHEIELRNDGILAYWIKGPNCQGGTGSVKRAKTMIDHAILRLTCQHTRKKQGDSMGRSFIHCLDCGKLLGRSFPCLSNAAKRRTILPTKGDSMNDDLVERLKVHGLRDGSMKERLLIEAVSELTRLRKENERLYKLVLGRTDQAKKLRIENHDLRGEVASLRSGAAAQEERPGIDAFLADRGSSGIDVTDEQAELVARAIVGISDREVWDGLDAWDRSNYVLNTRMEMRSALNRQVEPAEGGTEESPQGPQDMRPSAGAEAQEEREGDDIILVGDGRLCILVDILTLKDLIASAVVGREVPAPVIGRLNRRIDRAEQAIAGR